MQPTFKSNRSKLALLGTVVVALFLYGFTDYTARLRQQLEIFDALFREVNTSYVDSTDPGKLMQTGVEAMLASLDPYTTYIPETDKESYRAMTTGQYGGIGAVIKLRGDRVVISEPYEGFPAGRAGLRAGDELVEVDGQSMRGKKTEQVSRLLKGPPGTSVRITVWREGVDSMMHYALERQEIKVKSVPFQTELSKGIGYIKLVNFTEKCSKELESALRQLDREQALKGLVLDLRGNPGGLLQEAIDVTSLFVEKGVEVVATRGRLAESTRSYPAGGSAFSTKIPVVVLVNSSSASAAEIVAGCLQDLDRGVIIGQRTYGKGLVQSTRPLGHDAQLKVTTAKYYIPSGRCIQAVDYSQRNPDGSVGKVPDSLQHEFRTRSGRIVKDGGGILPDLVTERANYSPITGTLISRNLIFDYATYYRTRHDSVPDPSNFELTESGWKDFLSYLKNKEYGYTTKTEQTLEELRKNAEAEGYMDRIDKEYDALHQRLDADKKSDLDKNREEIVQVLEEEIMTRYFYQSGRTAASLEHDREVQEAVRILKDASRYRNFLSGSN